MWYLTAVAEKETFLPCSAKGGGGSLAQQNGQDLLVDVNLYVAWSSTDLRGSSARSAGSRLLLIFLVVGAGPLLRCAAGSKRR